MTRTLRFLLSTTWVNLGAIFGFAAIVIAGCYATGVPGSPRTGNLFETYYAMFPTMVLLMLFLYSFSMCTNNLNMGLSMGARRKNFFWAIQANMAFYAAVCWALQLFMSALPALANWEVRERWTLLSPFGGRVWAFPMVCVALMILGCLSGMVMVRNKIAGTLLVMLSVFVMIGTTVVMMLSTDTNIMFYLYGTRWSWLWAVLPKAVTVGLAAGAVGGELLIWRSVQRYVVR